MIYVLDNGMDYSDHRIAFVKTHFPAATVESVSRWRIIGMTEELEWLGPDYQFIEGLGKFLKDCAYLYEEDEAGLPLEVLLEYRNEVANTPLELWQVKGDKEGHTRRKEKHVAALDALLQAKAEAK